MEIFLQATDVLNFAVRIEEDGESFYRKAALEAKGEAIKELFIHLADEEIEHMKVFQGMLAKIEEYRPTESYGGEYMAYLRDYIDNKIVFTKEAERNRLSAAADALSAIDFAMQRELDSILYYQEVKQFIMERQRGVVDNIIAEERNHFALLAEAKKNYGKTKSGGSEMSRKLIEYFNKQPRLGCLSTANRDGKTDVAILGSPQMVDEKTVIISLRNNRTFANLQENPYAVFAIMEPGKTAQEWKGVRVYLRMVKYETSGELLDKFKAQLAKRVSEEVAKLAYAAVTFELYEVRPIIDAGQGWENSI